MKKNKKIAQVKNNVRGRSVKSKRLPLVHQTKPLLRHFRLLELKHGGKIVHHKNTSHVGLLVVLLIFGLFLYFSGGYTGAYTTSGLVSVGLTVVGPPPLIGAEITSPINNEKFVDDNIIRITGTCAKNTFVVVKSGNLIIGSKDCKGGHFNIKAQIEFGENILTAKNYDNINQAGPDTAPVTVFLSKSEVKVPDTTTTNVVPPSIPENPVKLPDDESKDCREYDAGNLTTGGEPHIEVVCLPRLFLPKIEQVMGIIAWGGTPPYAISINLGEDELNPILVSMSAPGYKAVSFSYAVPNTYKVALKMIDQKAKESIVETSVKVSGAVVSSNDGDSDSDDVENVIQDIVDSGWFNTPVPFYLLAVALTLGFWGGDLFDRRYGAGSTRLKKRNT